MLGWRRGKNRISVKVVSLLIAQVFLLTDLAYTAPSDRSLFRDKRPDYKRIQKEREKDLEKRKDTLSKKKLTPKTPYKKDLSHGIKLSSLKELSSIYIPDSLGRVIEVHQATSSESRVTPVRRSLGEGGSHESRLVVHIQDLHTNPEAQFNMAGILELLIKDYGLDLVCSEGAEGVVDTSSVSSFPDPEVREKTARLFVDSGELTAEEYLSITKYPDLPIWGIEDKDIYFQNIIEFNKIMRFSPDATVFTGQVKAALEELKPRIYSKALLDIDDRDRKYEEGEMETGEYLDFLFGFGVDNKFKNIAVLRETLELEKDIDQEKIIQESQDLLRGLQAVLKDRDNKSEIQALLAKASLFKDQKISPFSFYSYLDELARRHLRDDLDKYPNLFNFVAYLEKVNALDSVRLFQEIEDFTHEVKDSISANEDQRLLTKSLRHIKYLEDLFNLKMSNEELDYYLANKEGFKVGWFKSAIITLTATTGHAAYIDFNSDLIDMHLATLEHFYRIAKERDIAMIDNAIAEIERRDAKVTALISGGFHTRGLTNLLKGKGYSYVVISPYSSTEIDEENYRFLLSGKRRPLSELIDELSNLLRPALTFSSPEFRKAAEKAGIPSLKGPGRVSAVKAHFDRMTFPSLIGKWLDTRGNVIKGGVEAELDIGRSVATFTYRYDGKLAKTIKVLEVIEDRTRILSLVEETSFNIGGLKEADRDNVRVIKSFLPLYRIQRIVKLQDDRNIRSFLDRATETLYLSEYFFNRDGTVNIIALFHEIGEWRGIILPKKYNLNKHTYLRGCGEDIRHIVRSLIGEGRINDSTPVKGIIKLVEERLSELNIQKPGQTGTRALTRPEKGLILYNHSLGLRGIALTYGLQDKIFGIENELFTVIFSKQAIRDSEVRSVAEILRGRLGRPPNIAEVARHMPSINKSPDPESLLYKWFEERELNPMDYGIEKFSGKAERIIKERFLYAGTRIYLPPQLSNRLKIVSEHKPLSEERMIELVDIDNPGNRIILENVSEDGILRLTYICPDGTEIQSDIPNSKDTTTISPYLIPAFRDFYDTVFSIPLEPGPERLYAIARHLKKEGVLLPQDKIYLNFHGRLMLPSFYNTNPGHLDIYRDRRTDARWIIIRDAADPNNLVGYEWRDNDNIIISLGTGEELSPDSFVSLRGGRKLPIYNMSSTPDFRTFDEKVDKSREVKIIDPSMSRLEEIGIGNGRFAFRVNNQVKVISFKGMRAISTRDDRRRYPIILTRTDNNQVIRIGYENPDGDRNRFVVEGLTLANGAPLILKGRYFNLSTIVEMIRRGLLEGVEVSDWLLETLDFNEGAEDINLVNPIRSYKLVLEDGKSLLLEDILVHPRTFDSWDSDRSSARFSLGSKDNSFTKKGEPTTRRFSIGTETYSVDDLEAIKQGISELGAITAEDSGVGVTFTIHGPPAREGLVEYLRDNLPEALNRSRTLQPGELSENITIILADRYDYLAGDHRKNNIIILNASDLEKMIQEERDPLFISELITSILSEELAHERGAGGDGAAEERLAKECANKTTYVLRTNAKTLSYYIAFLKRHTEDIEGQEGYLGHLKKLQVPADKLADLLLSLEHLKSLSGFNEINRLFKDFDDTLTSENLGLFGLIINRLGPGKKIRIAYHMNRLKTEGVELPNLEKIFQAPEFYNNEVLAELDIIPYLASYGFSPSEIIKFAGFGEFELDSTVEKDGEVFFIFTKGEEFYVVILIREKLTLELEPTEKYSRLIELADRNIDRWEEAVSFLETPELKARDWIKDFMKQDPDCYIGFGDMIKIGVMNKVFTREIVDILIPLMVDAADLVLREYYGGGAVRLGGDEDEVGLALPSRLSWEEVNNIRLELQFTLGELIADLYGFVKIDGVTDENIESVKAAIREIYKDSFAEIYQDKDGFFLMFDREPHDLKEVMKRLEQEGEDITFTEVPSPRMSFGIVKAMSASSDAQSNFDSSIRYAEYVRNIAMKRGLNGATEALVELDKDEFQEIIRHPSIPRLSEERREEIVAGYTKSGIILSTDWLEEVYPAIKRKYLYPIIRQMSSAEPGSTFLVRGPPDDFYIVAKATDDVIHLVRIEFLYRPDGIFKERVGKAKREAEKQGEVDGERLRQRWSDEEWYGFKIINHYAGQGDDHGLANSVILAEAEGLDTILREWNVEELPGSLEGLADRMSENINQQLGEKGIAAEVKVMIGAAELDSERVAEGKYVGDHIDIVGDLTGTAEFEEGNIVVSYDEIDKRPFGRVRAMFREVEREKFTPILGRAYAGPVLNRRDVETYELRPSLEDIKSIRQSAQTFIGSFTIGRLRDRQIESIQDLVDQAAKGKMYRKAVVRIVAEELLSLEDNALKQDLVENIFRLVNEQDPQLAGNIRWERIRLFDLGLRAVVRLGWGHKSDVLEFLPDILHSDVNHRSYNRNISRFLLDVEFAGSPARKWIIDWLSQKLGVNVTETSVFRMPWQHKIIEELWPSLVETRLRQGAERVSVISLGASNGAEIISAAVTILMAEEAMPPDSGRLPALLQGIEIHPELVEKARRFLETGRFEYRYIPRHMVRFAHQYGIDMLPERLREVEGSDIIRERTIELVKQYLPEIRKRDMIHFKEASIVDSDSLEAIAESNIIFINYVLYQIEDDALLKLSLAIESIQPGAVIFSNETLEDFVRRLRWRELDSEKVEDILKRKGFEIILSEKYGIALRKKSDAERTGLQDVLRITGNTRTEI